MKVIATVLALLVLVTITTTVNAQSTTYLTETLLNQDPDPAEPGEYLEIRWKVEKVGNGNIDNLAYTLEAEYPFFFDQTDTAEKNLGNWDGFVGKDDFYILFYKLRVNEDAIEDVYTVKLKRTTDIGTKTTSIVKEFDIRVGENEVPEFIIGQLSTSPTKLTGDLDEAELNVELANIGDGDAENVFVELELPEGFTPSYSYSDRSALGTISSGSSKTATFYVDIEDSVTGGVHDAKLKISYKESSDDNPNIKTKMIDLDLPLKDMPTFEIEQVTTSPESVIKGSEVELRIRVKNTGGEKAESVSVRLFKDSSQPIDLVEKSDFIGNLEPGESGEAILRIEFDQDAAAKKYMIDVEIRAIDNNEVIVQDKTISIELTATDQPGVTGNFISDISPMSLGLFVLVIIIVAVVSFKLGKSRSSSKKPTKNGA